MGGPPEWAASRRVPDGQQVEATSDGHLDPADFWSILRPGRLKLLGRTGGGRAVSGTMGDEAAAGIAGRVRAARRAAGMTQVELAAGRFTKQYVSQIERGEVVPSSELLEWLAQRLGVERMFLETGVGASDLERL